MADKLDFNSPEELEACLQENSPEWAQALAARTALRVFPLVLSIADVSDEILSAPRKQNLILQAFRANYISWAARKYPAHDLSFAAAAAADFGASFINFPTAFRPSDVMELADILEKDLAPALCYQRKMLDKLNKLRALEGKKVEPLDPFRSLKDLLGF